MNLILSFSGAKQKVRLWLVIGIHIIHKKTISCLYQCLIQISPMSYHNGKQRVIQVDNIMWLFFQWFLNVRWLQNSTIKLSLKYFSAGESIASQRIYCNRNVHRHFLFSQLGKGDCASRMKRPGDLLNVKNCRMQKTQR